MKKLISMTDFVLEQNKQLKNAPDFFKQTPTLGDFVACDEKGNVLEEPNNQDLKYDDIQGQDCMFNDSLYYYDLDKYQQAQSKVIFKGFELNQKDIAKLRNVFCLTKGNFQLTFFKNEKDVFIDNLITNQTFEIKTIEDLVPYNLELV